MFKKFLLVMVTSVLFLNFGCLSSGSHWQDPNGTSVWFGKEVSTTGDMPKVGMVIKVHQVIDIPSTKEQTVVWQEFDGEVLSGDVKKVTTRGVPFFITSKNGGVQEKPNYSLYIVYSSPREGIAFFPYL
jgi:hypothetical protein